jgi:hypothetical protein
MNSQQLHSFRGLAVQISKPQLDRLVETKRDLAILEREHADAERKLISARAFVLAFEDLGVRYDMEQDLISFSEPPIARRTSASAETPCDDDPF